MEVELPMFILDLTKAPETGPVHNWLDQDQEMRVNNLFVKTNLKESFDAIFFVEEVSRAHHTPRALERMSAGN
jgi:hypothetical protein